MSTGRIPTQSLFYEDTHAACQQKQATYVLLVKTSVVVSAHTSLRVSWRFGRNLADRATPLSAEGGQSHQMALRTDMTAYSGLKEKGRREGQQEGRKQEGGRREQEERTDKLNKRQPCACQQVLLQHVFQARASPM